MGAKKDLKRALRGLKWFADENRRLRNQLEWSEKNVDGLAQLLDETEAIVWKQVDRLVELERQ